jgi:hypothetical protein
MAIAIERPYRLPSVGGAYGVVYRHGTYGKHRETDGKLRREGRTPNRAAFTRRGLRQTAISGGCTRNPRVR